MKRPPKSPWLVPFDEAFDAAAAPTRADDAPSKKRCEKELARVSGRLADEQRKLMAHRRHAVLLVFQALDAGGKDGTIRALTSGLDGAGCETTAFRQPSPEELDHDFLWRIVRHLPARGTIGIFNRSHYEEVLVARVSPDVLAAQRIPGAKAGPALWEERFESIRCLERHLARNGTVIRKFWLNVSKDEQRRRFLDRIDERRSQWKFSAEDIEKRRRREDYLRAYSDALTATSRPWAPWYAVPADDKPHARLEVARILLETLESLDLEWPRPSKAERAEMKRARRELERDE